MLPLAAYAAIGALALLLSAIAVWTFADAETIRMLGDIVNSVKSFWDSPFFTIGNFRLTVQALVKLAIVFLVLWFGTRVAGRLLRTKVLDKTDLNEGLKFSVQRVTSYLFFGIGALVGLEFLGVDLGSLAVFSGALGIGIGLGFQTIAKNFASGLILLFEQPIKVGDRVQVGDLMGNIVNIGSRGTWVRTNDNIVMIVPNSEFIEGRVTNWTANDRYVRINLPLGVSYNCDPEHVRDVILGVAREHPDVLEDPSPGVIFTGFGASSLDFRLRVWTRRQVSTPRTISSQLYFNLFAALKREDIEIPFPQRDLHLRSAPALERPEALSMSKYEARAESASGAFAVKDSRNRDNRGSE